MGTALGAAPAWGQPSITGGEVECQDGTANGYPCQNVDLLSFLSINDLGGTPQSEVNDVWGWTDPETGTEYALVGRSNGIAIVDVSTPTDPVYVGELPTHSGPSTWRDVKVYQNHAFVVSEADGHGMQVFDLTQLRDVAPEAQPVTFAETAHYDEVESAHNIAINTETGFGYIVGGNGSGATCGGGLHMMNLETPTAPVFVGCFADPTTGRAGTGYTHDAQCVVYQGPDAGYQGAEVCFNANETALNIADVSNKSNPATIVNTQYPQVGYTHQAWLTEDHRYLYVDDEFDELQGFVSRTRTLVFDVTDLDNPTLVQSYAGATPAIDHNQYIEGPYSYQANYTSGLRLLDVADPERPEEVAFFDTFPSNNDSAFQGAWSTYPFFEPNMVVVSSIGEGLFVLEPNPPPLLSLTGTVQTQAVRVQWFISATVQTQESVVEHRPPGADAWQQIETVPGRDGDGVQEYEFSLDNPAFGTHRFRVRHVSTNGTTYVSDAIDIQVLPTEPIRSLTATQQAQAVRVQWSIAAAVQTQESVVEHRPPEATAWQQIETVPGRDGDGVQEYEFSLDNPAFGPHRFRVRHLSTSGTTYVSDPVNLRVVPTEPYVASGPNPNPVRSQGTFEITLRETQPLRIALYDVMGRQVEVLHDGPVQKGVIRRVRIPVRRRASGTYFLRVRGESFRFLRKVVVAR